MTATLYSTVLAIHIVCGVAGLAAFWLPAVARKGGTTHVRAGRVFYWATCVVAVTGLGMASLLLLDPLGARPPEGSLSAEGLARAAAGTRQFVPFLVYLLLITFAPVYHGVRVLETRREPYRLRTPFHTGVSVAAMVGAAAMVGLALLWRQPVFAALSPIGFLIGPGQLRFARQPHATHMAWWYEHMGSMMGGGIAFHTAFLVLGAGRLTGVQFTGPGGWIPWVIPALIGIPVSSIWIRYYRRKFGETGPRQDAVIAGSTAGRQPAAL